MDPESHFEEMWACMMHRPGFSFRNLNQMEQEGLKDLMKCMFVTTSEMVLDYVKKHPEEMLTVIVPGGLEDGGASKVGETGGR